MSNAKVFSQPQLESSALSDGTTVFVASVEEMPGVVCEGRTPEEAVSELITSLLRLRERFGWGAVAIRTPAVQGCRWQSSTGTGEVVDLLDAPPLIAA